MYHARDVAVMRGTVRGRCPVVLASATPAIETRQHGGDGQLCASCSLPSRYGVAQMPEIAIVDLTQDPPESSRWLAPLAGDRAAGDAGATASSRCSSSTAAAMRR